MVPVGVRTLRRHRVLVELRKNVPNLEAFLEVVVLVSVDELEVFTAIENDRMVLVIRLSISKNWVPRELNAELGSPASSLRDELAVTIDKRREDPRITTLLPRGLLLQVRNLQIRVCTQQKLGILMLLLVELGKPLHRNNKLEFPPRHPLEFPLQLIGVAAKELHDLGILDMVKQFDSLGVVHHAGNRPVQGLSAEQGPDTCSEGEFRCSALEANKIEWEIIDFGIFLIVGKGIDTVEHGGLFREDLGILDKVLPFDRVELLEVLEERNAGVLILFTDDLSERKKCLKMPHISNRYRGEYRTQTNLFAVITNEA